MKYKKINDTDLYLINEHLYQGYEIKFALEQYESDKLECLVDFCKKTMEKW